MNPVIANLIPAVVGAGAMLLVHGLVGRRWRKEREEKQWAEALAMARVVEDSSESELAKMIARQRLHLLGVTPDWIAAEKRSTADAARHLFGMPEPSRDEVDVIERAVSDPLPIDDPDLQALVKVVTYVDGLFQAARSEARAEEDTRVRIFVVTSTFVAAFVALAIAAIWRVLG